VLGFIFVPIGLTTLCASRTVTTLATCHFIPLLCLGFLFSFFWLVFSYRLLKLLIAMIRDVFLGHLEATKCPLSKIPLFPKTALGSSRSDSVSTLNLSSICVDFAVVALKICKALYGASPQTCSCHLFWYFLFFSSIYCLFSWMRHCMIWASLVPFYDWVYLPLTLHEACLTVISLLTCFCKWKFWWFLILWISGNMILCYAVIR